MVQMSNAVKLLTAIGISTAAVLMGAGCNTAPTTQANANGIRGDVTDVRPIEPVQAAYQPPLYDNATNIPTAQQPITQAPIAQVASSRVTPMISDTPSVGHFGGKTHTVRHGETLFSIARSSYGDGKAWKKIVSANPGVSPSKLKVGQVLTMPS